MASADEWFVQLTCCGRDDGIYVAPSWTDADAFRASYINARGHGRSAIIVAHFTVEEVSRDET